IGAARPAIADPFLPRKIAEGRLADIRECTGSNVCILREEEFGQIGCIQNPTAGEEFRRGWHPEIVTPLADPAISVLVVGAGPAGMECAIVLGRRGARAVHLVDAGVAIGGRLLWTRRLPTLGDWGRVIDWRATQLEELPNVEVVLNRRLSAADVLDYGADVIVIATGSRWASDGSLTPERVMAGERPRGPRVVVADEDGYYVGPGIAEMLSGEGYQVVLATPHPVVSPISDGTLEGPMLRRHLHATGVEFRTGVTVTHREDDVVLGADEFGRPVRLPADDLVLVTRQVPVDDLYRELAADDPRLRESGIRSVHLIGDAAAPGWISEAVFDGHRLARELESPDPSRPLPMRREEQ
ncbi:MAG: FAD-dependent oxidoreductase, partial [Actinomycetota bacterium]|nr:FAD-dependent oxidoreductase [Actinomycetota bacterium]